MSKVPESQSLPKQQWGVRVHPWSQDHQGRRGSPPKKSFPYGGHLSRKHCSGCGCEALSSPVSRGFPKSLRAQDCQNNPLTLAY